MSNQQQIEAINAKIAELHTAAAELQAEVDKLQQEPEQWEPKSGRWICDFLYGVNAIAKSNENFNSVGAYSQTEANAKERHELLRTTARLHAYVEEFGGDWVADWSNKSQSKHCIKYDHTHSGWFRYSSVGYQSLTTVYMSRECAEGLVEKLNSGVVTL